VERYFHPASATAAGFVGVVGAGMRDHRLDQVGTNHQHVTDYLRS
jgi:hypothetical protein